MKIRLISYWTTTGVLALELLVGGAWDLMHLPYVVGIVTHLGYPIYVLTILGFWKLLASAALLAPRFPRLKEWASAGVFFEMTGAAASHAARGDSPGHMVAPLVFAAITVASWALRPPSRALGVLLPGQAGRLKRVNAMTGV